MFRRRLHLEVRIRSFSSYPRSSGTYHWGKVHGVMCPTLDPVSFGLLWCGFMSVSFDLRIIGGGCCSDVLVLRGLSTITFYLSTTTSFTTTSFF
jgi:hypothetical protein